jgi:hypothetical protein
MSRWIILIVFFSAFCLASCKSNPDNKEKKTGFQTQKEKKTDEIVPAEQKPVYYRFPSAKEMLSYLKTEDLVYRTDLMNPVNNLEKYHNTRSKTLNLGVYLADLSYMILFEKTQQVEKYFNAIFNLSADLRINAPHEERLLQKISENMHNPDSLIEIADQYHTDIIDYLLNTGKEKTLAVISTGSYIEGLYIATHLISEYDKHESTVRKIADQKHAFQNLTKFAKDFSEDINTQYSLDCLKKINQHFKDFPVIKDKTEIKRANDSTLVFEGGNKIEISKEHFENLKQQVTLIRNKIITNSTKGADE